MIPECPECPYKHWPTWCHAAATGHRRYCDLVRTRLDYREIIEARTLNRPVVQAQAPPPTPPDPRGVAAREQIARIQQIKKCQYRTNPETGCQSGCATCLRSGPDNPRKVNLHDCLACDLVQPPPA